MSFFMWLIFIVFALIAVGVISKVCCDNSLFNNQTDSTEDDDPQNITESTDIVETRF